jgi:hypothetical protein
MQKESASTTDLALDARERHDVTDWTHLVSPVPPVSLGSPQESASVVPQVQMIEGSRNKIVFP